MNEGEVRQLIAESSSALEASLRKFESGFTADIAGIKETTRLNIDPIRETGFQRDKEAIAMRKKALNDYASYHRDRQAEMDKVEANIRKTYQDVFQQFNLAGHPTDKCESEAIAAAEKVGDIGKKAVIARFGQLNDEIANMKETQKAQENFSGVVLNSI